MKNFKLLTTLAIVMSLAAIAADDCTENVSKEVITGKYEIKTDVPNYLKGAKITVTLANGKSSTVPAELFKVVPRKQQFITAKTEQTKTLTCNGVQDKKNRVSLLGGRGSQGGFDTSSPNPTTIAVESRVGFVGGLQYQRKVYKDLSVGVQGQTNKTGSFLLGLDF